MQTGERRSISVEEAGWTTANDAVKRRDPLLPVEKQVDPAAGWSGCVPTRRRIVDVGLPDQEAPDGMPAIERVHQAADLLPVPDVSALELRKRHLAEIDLLQDGSNLHELGSFILRFATSLVVVACRGLPEHYLPEPKIHPSSSRTLLSLSPERPAGVPNSGWSWPAASRFASQLTMARTAA